MSCEILMMNKNSVALSATSEITYENKIFKLSNTPPLGIMTFGSNSFMDIPMETIVKEYIKKTNFKEIDSISKHIGNFLDYLEEIGTKNQKDYEISTEEFERLIDILDNISIEVGSYKISEDTWKMFKDSGFFTKLNFENIIKKHHKSYNMKKLKILEKFFISLLPRCTIVIAGFNKNEMFPSYSAYEVYHVYEDELFFEINNEKINYKNPIIEGFYKTDFIDSLLYGMNLNIISALENYLINENIEEKILNSFVELINILIVENKEEFLESINTLSKEELWKISESIVYLNSIKNEINIKNPDLLILSKNGIISKKNNLKNKRVI